MAEYCTIFGQDADYAGVLRRIRETSVAFVGVVGDESRWKKLVLKGRHATLTLNSMEREKAGDDFSKLVLSTHNFLRKSCSNSTNKDSVLKAVSSCSIAVGIVAEPALDEREGHMACVLDVARILKGVIFNGSAMLDSDGVLLLDAKAEAK
jgi:hypothetical protein